MVARELKRTYAQALGLNQAELIEIKDEVGNAFPLDPALCKTRIEKLIDREFLKRKGADMDGQAGYEYVA